MATKHIRPIVRDALKCDELVYQFGTIDVEDGLLSGDNWEADLNEKYSDDAIIGEAENRLDIAHHNIKDLTNWDGSTYDPEMLGIHKKEARQLERFLKKYK